MVALAQAHAHRAMSLVRIEPHIFRDPTRAERPYIVRWSVRGRDHWKQGIPSLEQARRYRDKILARKVLRHLFPEQAPVRWAEAVALYLRILYPIMPPDAGCQIYPGHR